MLPMKNKEYGVVEEFTTELLSFFRLSLKMWLFSIKYAKVILMPFGNGERGTGNGSRELDKNRLKKIGSWVNRMLNDG
jgi:hypothetical protein